MEELDDLTRVAHLDRAGLLTRAANRAAWLKGAETAVEATFEQYRGPGTPFADAWIGLRVPAELRGVGGLTRRLGAMLGMPVRLLDVDVTVHDCAGASVVLDAAGGEGQNAKLHGDGIPGPLRWAIDVHCRAADHPVQSLLYLFGLLVRFAEGGGGRDASANDAWTAVQRELRETAPVSIWQLATPTAHNPVKQLAVRLLDRVPVFWGAGVGSELALDWAVRQLWYAERAAMGIDAHALARMWVMARGPGYWPNTAHFVQMPVGERETGADDAGPAPVGAQAPSLLVRRRFACSVAPGIDDPQATGEDMPMHSTARALRNMIRGLEMGEWLGLYSACLYQIDPADRVPLDLLFGP